MEVYTSEHEQVEALQRWWKKNARTVIVALFVIGASIWGWGEWQQNREQKGQAASEAYQNLFKEMQNPEKATAAGRALIAQYPGSEYAVLASLAMATTAVNQKDFDAAAAHLRYAIDNAKVAGVKQAATARLARVLLAQQKPKEAQQVLDGASPEGFEGEFNELRGDIQLALGDRAAAHASYQKAVTAYASAPSKLAIVQMKLDDAADAAGSSK